MSKYGVISGPYFAKYLSVLSPNVGKYVPEITPYLDTFHVVSPINLNMVLNIPGQVKYLPHEAVIRDDDSSTKLCVVFDASSETIGRSLNDILYKGTCLLPLCYYVFDLTLWRYSRQKKRI